MIEQQVSIDSVANYEDVARMLFSPLFICDGILSQKAFTLEADKSETYISVLRPAIPSFGSDMDGIKKRLSPINGEASLAYASGATCTE